MKRARNLGMLTLASLVLAIGRTPADEPKPVPADQFDHLHKTIKPQEGESLFWQVPWLLSLDEALIKGAKEGKPVLVWSGAGGTPHTVC